MQALRPSWRMYWNSSTARKGYSGVALLSRWVPSRELDVRIRSRSGLLQALIFSQTHVLERSHHAPGLFRQGVL